MISLEQFWKEEDGQDLIEYSLLMAFIALAVVSLLGAVHQNIANLWISLNSKISSAAVSTAGS